MDLIHPDTAGLLMKTVDVLGNNTVKFTLAFHPGQGPVGFIGLHLSGVKILTEVGEKDFRLFAEAVIAQEIFRPIAAESLLLLPVEAIFTPEVRDTAFCRYTCPA